MPTTPYVAKCSAELTHRLPTPVLPPAHHGSTTSTATATRQYSPTSSTMAIISWKEIYLRRNPPEWVLRTRMKKCLTRISTMNTPYSLIMRILSATGNISSSLVGRQCGVATTPIPIIWTAIAGQLQNWPTKAIWHRFRIFMPHTPPIPANSAIYPPTPE